jgi:hypothetical protein
MTMTIINLPHLEDFRQAEIKREGMRRMIYLGMIKKRLEFSAVKLYMEQMKRSAESHAKPKPTGSWNVNGLQDNDIGGGDHKLEELRGRWLCERQ